MFKLFQGFHLVDAYHREKRARRFSPAKTELRVIKLSVAILLTLAVWMLPTDAFGIPGFTIIEQRMTAIFIFGALMWMLDAVPAWTTSVLLIVIMLFTVSDSTIWFFSQGYDPAAYGTAVSYKAIMHSFADPIIMLFIGGFILAIGATKSGLDIVLARTLLRPFGSKSKFVLLGFILVTALFSMFLSNTATAAMMLMFLAPVLKSLPDEGRGKAGLALAIPIGANIGGMATPIGTPPNAIALKYLNDPDGLNLNIGFGEWMSFMFPFTIVVLLIAWMVLRWLFPFKEKTIVLHLEGETKHDWRSIVVMVTTGVTLLMWVCDSITGVNSNVVAMIPVGVFCITGIITRRDLEEINWSVLWMVAGGFALGEGLNATGLARHIIENIPFGTWPPVAVVIGSGLICYGLSNVISNTATAALLVPILAIAGISMGSTLGIVGGVSTLLIGLAISSSMAMILPISTPPNALAHATGLVKQSDFVRIGAIMGAIGLVLGYSMLIILGTSGRL